MKNDKKHSLILLSSLIFDVAGSIYFGCGLWYIGAVIAAIGAAITAYEVCKAGFRLRGILIMIMMLTVACGLLTLATVLIQSN